VHEVAQASAPSTGDPDAPWADMGDEELQAFLVDIERTRREQPLRAGGRPSSMADILSPLLRHRVTGRTSADQNCNEGLVDVGQPALAVAVEACDREVRDGGSERALELSAADGCRPRRSVPLASALALLPDARCS